MALYMLDYQAGLQKRQYTDQASFRSARHSRKLLHRLDAPLSLPSGKVENSSRRHSYCCYASDHPSCNCASIVGFAGGVR